MVDCFDALTSDRPYRPRMEDPDALQIISDRRGNMYDPQVVDAFFALHGTEIAASPALEIAPVAAVAQMTQMTGHPPLELVAERREDLDLQTFFNLGRALGAPAAPAQLGEILWTHLRTRLPADAFVLYGTTRRPTPFSRFIRRVRK